MNTQVIQCAGPTTSTRPGRSSCRKPSAAAIARHTSTGPLPVRRHRLVHRRIWLTHLINPTISSSSNLAADTPQATSQRMAHQAGSGTGRNGGCRHHRGAANRQAARTAPPQRAGRRPNTQSARTVADTGNAPLPTGPTWRSTPEEPTRWRCCRLTVVGTNVAAPRRHAIPPPPPPRSEQTSPGRRGQSWYLH